MNTKKILAIGTLPLMWFIYILFEFFTGRITNLTTIVGNIFLIILFAVVGYFFYKFASKKPDGLSTKSMWTMFLILMLLDQGIKIIIKLFFFNSYVNIIDGFLSFNPLINTNGSWLNARFGTSVSFSVLIILNIVALILFVELYRYYKSKGNKDIFADLSLIFISSGALCSLIDKVFYGGSLDFIGISTLFVADFKDIYINLGILFLIICLYNNNFFSNEDDTTLKDDINSLKKFLSFAFYDIKSLLFKNKKQI
ncbi:signal peptidase II [Eubacterium multiforme]|uniref:Signal peptidase II n=1 Tax=Eubacterium multiforme TaxID=83339 RepID=A0ABT9UYD1_9FIRM|nr:signal peptidase II [Eubacterium multiforme]MDQ0151318.1 signal peptidase II [Eubacterium multiforme]